MKLDLNILNVFLEDILDPFGQWLVVLGEFLLDLLFLIISWDLKSRHGNVSEFDLFEFLELFKSILINWVRAKNDFESLGNKSLKNWVLHHFIHRFPSEVVNLSLIWFLSFDVLIQKSELRASLVGSSPEGDLSKTFGVVLILDDTLLDVLSILLPELLV